MAVFSSELFSRRAENLRHSFRHAFAVRSEQPAFTTEELALLERIAEAIVARRMAAPTTLFLESMGPMNFLAARRYTF